MGAARRNYNWLWNRYVAFRVGAQGQPPPPMRFGPTPYSGGDVLPGPAGQRQIILTPGTRRALKNPRYRNLGQATAVHEMRHAYQPDELFNNDQGDYRNQPREQDAYQFQNQVMRRIKRDTQRAKRHGHSLGPFK